MSCMAEISPQHKLSLYKIYGRPVLLYGLESLSLTQREFQKIQRTENNIIKGSLRLNRRCRTTRLIQAIGIESTKNTMQRIKCNFILRILKNPITIQITKNLIKLSQNTNNEFHRKSIMTEMTQINGTRSSNIQDLKNDSLISLSFLNEDLRQGERDEQANEIRHILDKYNYRSDAGTLSEILRAF